MSIGCIVLPMKLYRRLMFFFLKANIIKQTDPCSRRSEIGKTDTINNRRHQNTGSFTKNNHSKNDIQTLIVTTHPIKKHPLK